MKRTDVDAVLAEDRSDSPDHARHVAIVHDKHVTTRRRLDAEIIYLGDAANSISIHHAEQRSRDRLLAFRAAKRSRQQKVAHLLRDREGDTFLRLSRRRTKMRRDDHLVER